MAITKLLRLKEGKGTNRSAHLKNNIYYICNPEKTGGGCWIGGNAGTTPDVIYKTMLMNKRFWEKENGSQGFHYVISFPPDLKIDEAFVYRVTEEFCKELLGDSFYYCIAVHNDRDHMHAHITFDSVSKNDGRKFHSPKGDWEKRIQPITDRICKKYGIPALDYEKDRPKGMDYGSWKDGKEHVRKQKEGKFSWYDVIRDDIDEAIEASGTYEEFLENLKAQHYEVRDKKYLSLRPYGKDRSVRLGEEYTRERIIARIEGPKKGVEFKRYGDYEKASETVREYKKKNDSPTKYQKRFYYRYAVPSISAIRYSLTVITGNTRRMSWICTGTDSRSVMYSVTISGQGRTRRKGGYICRSPCAGYRRRKRSSVQSSDPAATIKGSGGSYPFRKR